MVPIFIGSVSAYSGKATLCLGLSLKFRADGFKTGYLKPIGIFPAMEGGTITDEDSRFFYHTLNLAEPIETICPVVLTREMIHEALTGGIKNATSKIMKAFKTVSKDKDAVFVLGIGELHSGTFIGASETDLIEQMDAKVILTSEYDPLCRSVDAYAYARDVLGDRLVGVVFNRVSTRWRDYIADTVAPFLNRRGIDVLGVIEKDPVLGAVPVSDLVEALNAKLICCEDAKDELVERFMVGAMNMESALRFFRKEVNKGVIVGGDRSDVQLAALETSTKCLILTGEMYPNEIILAKADEKRVPVMVVNKDTLSTVEICERLLGGLSLHSKKKIQRAAQVIEQEVDCDKIYQKVGLKKS